MLHQFKVKGAHLTCFNALVEGAFGQQEVLALVDSLRNLDRGGGKADPILSGLLL